MIILTNNRDSWVDGKEIQGKRYSAPRRIPAWREPKKIPVAGDGPILKIQGRNLIRSGPNPRGERTGLRA